MKYKNFLMKFLTDKIIQIQEVGLGTNIIAYRENLA
jgi:hypothetical protein